MELPWRGSDRSGEGLEIRRAVRRDAARLLDHLGQTVAETPWMLLSEDDALPSIGEQQDLLAAIDRHATCLSLVAVRPGPRPGKAPVIGHLSLIAGTTSSTQHDVTLGMGVVRRTWGVGVGSLLLDTALTWARANPRVVRVTLQVFSDNPRARYLYDVRGFEVEGVLEGAVKLAADRYADLVAMGLDVRGSTER